MLLALLENWKQKICKQHFKKSFKIGRTENLLRTLKWNWVSKQNTQESIWSKNHQPKYYFVYLLLFSMCFLHHITLCTCHESTLKFCACLCFNLLFWAYFFLLLIELLLRKTVGSVFRLYVYNLTDWLGFGYSWVLDWKIFCEYFGEAGKAFSFLRKFYLRLF